MCISDLLRLLLGACSLPIYDGFLNYPFYIITFHHISPFPCCEYCGGEGGTGAAPLVFTNSIGTPLIDALIFVNKQLKANGLRDQVRIIASGKASNSFDIIKLISLGADAVNAARAFMLSLGCIQARECNKNTCPVGIATQNKTLTKGLDPTDKKVRVANYHNGIIHEVKEVLGAMGLSSTSELGPQHIFVRTEKSKITNYKELFNL